MTIFGHLISSNFWFYHFFLSLTIPEFLGFLVEIKVDSAQPGRYSRLKNRADSTRPGSVRGLNCLNLQLFFQHVITNFKLGIFEFFLFLT